MFLIAKEASDGILGFSFIIFKATSLIASIVAVNLFDNFFGNLSIISTTVAWIYGSSLTTVLILNLFFPWIIIVVFPSGILRTLRIFATVPRWYISSIPGLSVDFFFWATTPISLFDLLASWISFIDLSLPALIGITTPGNRTVLIRGRIGSTSGNFSFSRASSSSDVINGINSESASKSSSDTLSKLLNFKLIL